MLPETAEMQGLKNVADMTRQELAVCIRDAWNQPNHYVGARRVPDEGVNEGEINDMPPANAADPSRVASCGLQGCRLQGCKAAGRKL